MVMRRFYILAVLAALALGACTMTEVAYGHENPLDDIYDSGAYRLVLTAQSVSATQVNLSWGSVYYKNEKGSVSAVSSLTGTPQLFYKSTAPTQAELDTIKKTAALTGYTSVACSITLGSAGTCFTSTAPYSGYYIIEATYNHDGRSGRLFSNFAVVQ